MMERLAGKIILLWGWRRAFVAFAAGALAVLAQAPFDFFAVCLVSFPLLVWLIEGAVAEGARGRIARLIPAFQVGWWFGFGYFLAGLWWIGNALLVEADSFAWALPLAVVLLPAGLALFYGLAAAIARLFWTDGIGGIVALAIGFGVAEWLRAILFTGFPWNAIGYAAMPLPVLMQSASVVGLYGMNALAVFVFAMPALLARRGGAAPGMVLAALLVAAHLGWGLYRSNAIRDVGAERTLSVRLVQPSIDQGQKWDGAARDRIFRTYLDMTTAPAAADAQRPDIILWPETAVPFLFTERRDGLAAIGEALADGQVLLAGALRAEGSQDAGTTSRYYNSILAIDDAGQIVAAADKVHLVPFGEYLPFEDFLSRIGLTKVVPLPQSFSAAASRTTLALPDGRGTALPLICYEAIFPGELTALAPASDFILNITNDAWFGDTPGPYQHFRQAQVRAVEFGLPLLRAANNGITAAVAADGRVLDGLALDAVGILDVILPLAKVAPPLGSPPRNGLLVLAFFAIWGCGALVLTSVRSN